MCSPIRYPGVIQLLYLGGHLYLIGVWLGHNQGLNTIKTCV